MDGPYVLHCPHCDVAISAATASCPECETSVRVRDGILTVGSDRPTVSDDWLEADELERLATTTETTSIREAKTAVLADHPHRNAVLSELFDIRRDDWRILAAGAVSGRCLDLNAGYGRRAHLLAELAESVYAVERNRAKLRVTASRTDFAAADSVVPVHTAPDELPFPDGHFDTVVADLTGTPFRDLSRSLPSISRSVSETGSLIVLADGLPRQLHATARVGLEQTAPSTPSLSWPTPGRIQSLLTGLGFDSVDVYALVPTARNVGFIFDAAHEQPVRALATMRRGGTDVRSRVERSLATLAARFGVLERLFPSYCVVARSTETSGEALPFDVSEPLVRLGRVRSVILDYESDDLQGVYKVPNKFSHRPVAERETAVLSELEASSSSAITDALPTGQLLESPFGPIRTERPASGDPLTDRLQRDVESVRRVLSTGFDWLARFQRECGREPYSRDGGKLERELTIESLGLEAPAFDGPVETFSTPVHGDFLTDNVYVRDGEVSDVIDWEYAVRDGSPVVDAALLPLSVGSRLFGDVVTGVRTLFCESNPYARTTRRLVGEYCDAVSLPRETFRRLLPIPYVHQTRLDWECRTITCSQKMIDKRRTIVDRLWELRDDIDLECDEPQTHRTIAN